MVSRRSALQVLGVALLSTVWTPAVADTPTMLTRKEWHARPAKTSLMTQQTPYRITVHHSGEPKNAKHSFAEKLRGLQAYSQDTKGWGDVPYHYYIDMTGSLGEGRDVSYAGDTNTHGLRYKLPGHILVVVEGNFQKEEPSDAQIASLIDTITYFAQTYHVPGSLIGKHNDFANTECPGKNLISKWSDITGQVAKRLT